ncbi:MAG: hypothetical protein WCI73_04685 [Phycisphaerae bacterium]
MVMPAPLDSPSSHRPRIIPDAYILLSNWRYLEYSILRILAGWGRCAADWQDKLALCHHPWIQAQVVQRLRQRLDMFPGGRPDGPVHAAFQHLADAVLFAPSFADAMAVVHTILNPTLAEAYRDYIATTHPVHDRPTCELLRELLTLKQPLAEWYSDFNTRHPHVLNAGYEARIRERLAAVGQVRAVIETPAEATLHALPCGKAGNFQLVRVPARPSGWDNAPNIMPYLQLDWAHDVEARRLFFMIGFMWEMGVAESQLRWIYSADFMPFDFVYAECRHLWDESRHGDSGRARLRDVGIDIPDVGYSSYGLHGDGTLSAMTPRELYEDFFAITQVAETGYFETKRYCFDDFAACGDDASAEMMQFDIIDETSHVEYGRLWLEQVSAQAGVSEDYRRRGATERKRRQVESDQRTNALRVYRDSGILPPDVTREDGFVGPYATLRDPKAQAHYQHLLQIVRAKSPFQNMERAPGRPNLPM